MAAVASCAEPEPDPNSPCGCAVGLTEERYEDLKRIAKAMLRGRRRSCDDPTSLVHRALLKVERGARSAVRSPDHEMAVTKLAMRHTLIDEHAKKRPDSVPDALLDQRAGTTRDDATGVRELIDELGRFDPRQARIARRKADGYTNKEQAAIEHVCEATIEAEWRHARAWLRERLARGDARS